MSSVPVIVGGAAKDSKLSAIIGATEKKIYDAYSIVGSVAKKIYQLATTWTYVGTHISGNLDIAYGCTANFSAYATVASVGGSDYSALFTFANSLHMNSGQTLTIATTKVNGSTSATTSIVKVNGNQVYTYTIGEGLNPTTITQNYTFSSDTDINTITVEVQESGGTDSGYNYTGEVLVTVNSSDGSFKLNSSGTSENQ